MVRILFAIVLVMHGLANLAGVVAPWTAGLAGFKDTAWAFSGGVTYKSWVGQTFSLVWVVSAIGLITAGVAVLFRQPVWVTLGILGSAFSLAAILPWWRSVPPGALFGAAVDLMLLILLATPLSARVVEAVK